MIYVGNNKIGKIILTDANKNEINIAKVYKDGEWRFEQKKIGFIVVNNGTSINIIKFNSNGDFNQHNIPTKINVETSVPFEVEYPSIQGLVEQNYNLISIDIKFNINGVRTIANAFTGCFNLKTINGIGSWNTSQVNDAMMIFAGCTSLTSLDLSNWDLNNASYTSGMFERCNNLTHIKCKQAFKDWCINNQDNIYLPAAMQIGGSGTWEIID